LVVWGYVVMPEHFHLLISEPVKGHVARVMQVLKQRVSRNCRRKKKAADQISLWKSHPARAFWQPRLHDFNVFTERKHIEKLRYMHRNPVKRGLVSSPELWLIVAKRGEELVVSFTHAVYSAQPLLR